LPDKPTHLYFNARMNCPFCRDTETRMRTSKLFLKAHANTMP